MIQPISRNDYVCNSLRTPNFTQKPNVKLSEEPIRKVIKDVNSSGTISDARLVILNLFSDAVMLLSGNKKRLIYNDYTGKLVKINLYEKGGEYGRQIKQVKHLYPNGKLQSLDEYRDGILVKSSWFQQDGKTLKWLSEYLHGEDIINEYYPDGKKVKFLTVDNHGYTNKYEYNEKGQIVAQEYYLEDVLQTKDLYDYKAKTVTKEQYKDGKLVYKNVAHQSGNVNHREIFYDEHENVKKVKIFYTDPKEYAEADYEGDIRTVKKYINNELKLTEITNRKTKEVKRIYPSKKQQNVKKS